MITTVHGSNDVDATPGTGPAPSPDRLAASGSACARSDNGSLSPCGGAVRAVLLVWSITLGEAVLLGFCGWVLSQYWLMLPIWLRVTGAGVLLIAVAIGVGRLIRFYVQRRGAAGQGRR